MKRKIATLEDAISIAAHAHKGQTDKAGAPYLMHPLRVMMRMESKNAQIAAILHDVVEDCGDKGYDFKFLREQGFSKEVLEVVRCLTKRDDETYDEFIKRVQTNQTAVYVKIADIEDNMNILRISDPQPRDFERLQRYHRAWHTLTKTEDF